MTNLYRQEYQRPNINQNTVPTFYPDEGVYQVLE